MFSFRRRKQLADVEPPIPQVEDPQPDLDVKLSLWALQANPDPERILQFLDVHLDAIEARDCLAAAWELLEQAEGARDVGTWSPGSLAMLAGLRARLGSGDRRAGLERSVRLYGEALKRFEAAGETEGAAIVRNNLGVTLVELAPFEPERYREAIPLLEEALDYYREACNEGFRASIWMALGDAYCGLREEGPDRHHLARNCFERAWSLFERDGDGARCELATAQGRLGDVQVALAAGGDGGSLEMAIRHFRNALAVFVDLEEPDQCGRYHARLADAYIRLSDMQAEHLRKGIRAYGRALEMFEQSGNELAGAGVCMELASLFQVTGEEGAPDLEAAVDYSLQALRLYGEGGDPTRRGEALRGLARIYLSADLQSDPRDVQQAVGCLEEALRLGAADANGEAYRAVHAELTMARQLGASLTPPVGEAAG